MKSKNIPAIEELTSNKDLSSIDTEATDFLNQGFKSKTGRPPKMNFSDLIYCLELKRKYSCETWIGLYRCLEDKVKVYRSSLKLPTYANFLKSIKRLIFYLFRLITYQTKVNRQLFLKQDVRIAFVDSTPLSVCNIKRSSRHKTMNKIGNENNQKFKPNYSKSTMGWYYGYKLHLTCDWETKEVIDFQFSDSKLDDRQYLKEIIKKQR